jgi:hypothetical protein
MERVGRSAGAAMVVEREREREREREGERNCPDFVVGVPEVKLVSDGPPFAHGRAGNWESNGAGRFGRRVDRGASDAAKTLLPMRDLGKFGLGRTTGRRVPHSGPFLDLINRHQLPNPVIQFRLSPTSTSLTLTHIHSLHLQQTPRHNHHQLRHIKLIKKRLKCKSSSLSPHRPSRYPATTHTYRVRNSQNLQKPRPQRPSRPRRRPAGLGLHRSRRDSHHRGEAGPGADRGRQGKAGQALAQDPRYPARLQVMT